MRLVWGLAPPFRTARRFAPDSKCGESRPETPEREGQGSGDPTPSRFWLGLPKCGERRTEPPEREGQGSGDPTPSRSWLGFPKCGERRTEPPEREG